MHLTVVLSKAIWIVFQYDEIGTNIKLGICRLYSTLFLYHSQKSTSKTVLH